MTNNIEPSGVEQVFARLAELRIWLPHGKDKAPQGICSDGIVRHLKDWGTTELMTLTEAQELAARVGLSGVGTVIKSSTVIEGRRLIALDVDVIEGYRKADPDKGITAITFDPDTEAENVLARVPMVAELPATYWEASPSCTGVHGLLLASDEWADRFANKGDLHPGGCDHAEFYSGAEPTYITITMRSLRALPIACLDEDGARYLESLGLEPRGAPAAPLPAIATDGQPLDLARYSLTPDQQKLVNGDGDIDRSVALHGLLIKILDAGASKEDALATIVHTPALWQYCLSHRGQNESKAYKFAGEEIGRAWNKTQIGMRQALTNFNEGWKPATPVETKATPFPDPFPGPMADIVKAALNAADRPQSALATLGTLIGMATACGSFYMFAEGGRLNLYGLGIAPTGYGKDMPLQIAPAIAHAAEANVMGDLASGAGLEDHVVSHIGSLACIDEISEEFTLMNGPRADHNKKAVNRKLKTYWSLGRRKMKKRALAGKKSEEIQNPALNLLGFTTPELLGKAFTPEDFSGGLAGRMLYVFTNIKPRRNKNKELFTLPDTAKDKARKIQHRLMHLMGTGETVIAMTDDAKARMDLILDEFDTLSEAGSSPLENALFIRCGEIMERIAGVLAVWDNPDKPVLTVEHIDWARRFVLASNAAVLEFIGDYMVGGDVQETAALILATLNKGVKPRKDRRNEVEADNKGCVARSALMTRVCKGRPDSPNGKQFNDAMQFLGQCGDIAVDDNDSSIIKWWAGKRG